jgi:hypothetical protein
VIQNAVEILKSRTVSLDEFSEMMLKVM